MKEILPLLFKLAILIFLWSTLMDMGIRLNLKHAIAGLRNIRFMFYTILWAFVLAPALAYVIAKFMPLDAPFADGLILQGLTPCAPFVAALVDRAKGDLNLTAALMVVCFVGTVILMPLILPLLVIPSLAAEATKYLSSKNK